jgi:hypothetical protein
MGRDKFQTQFCEGTEKGGGTLGNKMPRRRRGNEGKVMMEFVVRLYLLFCWNFLAHTYLPRCREEEARLETRPS